MVGLRLSKAFCNLEFLVMEAVGPKVLASLDIVRRKHELAEVVRVPHHPCLVLFLVGDVVSNMLQLSDALNLDGVGLDAPTSEKGFKVLHTDWELLHAFAIAGANILLIGNEKGIVGDEGPV
jgi:hypothetical protein